MNKGTSLQEHPQPFTISFQNHLAISCNWVAREDSTVWWHAGFLPCMRTLFLQQGQFQKQSLNSEVMWGSWKLINLQLFPVHLLILLSVLLCILLLLFLPFFCFFFSFFLSVYLCPSLSRWTCQRTSRGAQSEIVPITSAWSVCAVMARRRVASFWQGQEEAQKINMVWMENRPWSRCWRWTGGCLRGLNVSQQKPRRSKRNIF